MTILAIAIVSILAAALLGGLAALLLDNTVDTLEDALWGTNDPQAIAARRTAHRATTKEN